MVVQTDTIPTRNAPNALATFAHSRNDAQSRVDTPTRVAVTTWMLPVAQLRLRIRRQQFTTTSAVRQASRVSSWPLGTEERLAPNQQCLRHRDALHKIRCRD